MALTKAQVKEILSKAGVSVENTDAAVEAIMNGHLASVNALREERDEFKANAEKLPDVQKKLDVAEKKVAEAESADGKDKWKVKYDALKEEYDSYKSDVTAKETKQKKSDAYRELLKEVGISEKRLASVLRVTDLDKIEFDDEGKIKDSDKVKEDIKKEWEDFIGKEQKKGADTETPPEGKGAETHTPSRAAQVAAKRYEMLYGKAEGTK